MDELGHAPLSRKRREEAKTGNAVVGAVIGGAVGSLAGPWGAIILGAIGASFAYEMNPD